MNQYQVVSTIGSGSFGVAYLVKKRDAAGTTTGGIQEEALVVKRINLKGMSASEQESALNEAKVLKSFANENSFIIGYHDSFIENNGLHIVLDYANGGDLSAYIKHKQMKKSRLTERIVLKWYIQICSALKYIHSRHILHRDLKTQNIFLATVPGDKDFCVKLGDFGISKVLNSTSECANTIIGTPYYLSPELCEDKPYNEKSDVWALGCVLYEMCTLRHAFDGKSMCSLVVKILSGKYPPINTTGKDGYSHEVSMLVARMLQYRADERPSVASLLETPFLQSSIKDLEKTERRRLATFMRAKRGSNEAEPQPNAAATRRTRGEDEMRTREVKLQQANRDQAIKALSPDLKKLRQFQRSVLMGLQDEDREVEVTENARNKELRCQDAPSAPPVVIHPAGHRAFFQPNANTKKQIQSLATRLNAGREGSRRHWRAKRLEESRKEQEAVQEYMRQMKSRRRTVKSKYERQREEREEEARAHALSLKKQLRQVKPRINVKELRRQSMKKRQAHQVGPSSSDKGPRSSGDNWLFEGCVVAQPYVKPDSTLLTHTHVNSKTQEKNCSTHPKQSSFLVNVTDASSCFAKACAGEQRQKLQEEILHELEDEELMVGTGEDGDGGFGGMPWEDGSAVVDLNWFSGDERWSHNIAEAHEYSLKKSLSLKLRACNDLEDLVAGESGESGSSGRVGLRIDVHDSSASPDPSTTPTDSPRNLSQLVELLRLDCETVLGDAVFVKAYRYLAEANENESTREGNIEEDFFLITQDVVEGEDEQYTILGKIQLLLFYENKLNSKLNSNPRGGNWV